VEAERLVTANSFATTLGSVIYAVGLGTAGVIFHFTGTGFHAYAIVAATATLVYAVSALLTLVSFRVADLGPDEVDQAPVLMGLSHTTRGMVDGVRHLVHRPVARSMLLVHAVQRGLYGVLAITTLLLYRNYYAVGDPRASVTGLLPVAAAGALGSLAAAVLTPPSTRHLGGRRWVIIMMAALAALIPPLGLPYLPMVTVVAVLFVSLVTQSTKIVTDTVLQLEVEDDYRGRVFSINDTAYNFCFVAGLFIGAVTLRPDGHSPRVMVGVAVGYAVLAVWYGMSTLRVRDPAPPPTA
jgi:hypothetical protein